MIAAEVTASSPDFGHLQPMIEATNKELEAVGVSETAGVVVADTGYCHEEQMDNVIAAGTQVLIPPDAGKRGTPRRGWEVAVALETKTRTYSTAQLARTRRAASWLGNRHRDRAAIAVLVICAARAVQRWEGGVLVVSADQLAAALRALDAGDPDRAGLRDDAPPRRGDRLDGHARG